MLRADARLGRYERLAVRVLERHVLPAAPAAARMALALRDALPGRRGEQLVLPAARREHVRPLARRRARRLRVRREGQPPDHPPPEDAPRGGVGRALLVTRPAPPQ